MLNENTIPLIQVENMKKYYPVKGGIITHTTGYVKAVDDVSFSVMRGQTLGLVGESGCGKSTVGRQLVGLEAPTEGRIYYNGCDLAALQKNRKEMQRVRTKLQMVFQDPYSSLNPRKHIYEILAQPMLYHGISGKDTVEKDILKILDMVGLPRTALGRYPHEFSGGQRQRIGIAKALSLNPEFIVCDEPVSALDVSIQAQILNLLKELQRELGLTLLFVGHGLGAVNYVSDQIAVMYLGKIVEYGRAKEIFNNPVHPYTKRCWRLYRFLTRRRKRSSAGCYKVRLAAVQIPLQDVDSTQDVPTPRKNVKEKFQCWKISMVDNLGCRNKGLSYKKCRR